MEAGDTAQRPLADSGTIHELIRDVELSHQRKIGHDADNLMSTDKSAADGTNSEQGSSEKQGEDGKSVAGRKKMKDPRPKEERLAEAELNQILKRSPGKCLCTVHSIIESFKLTVALVIIVSKTWCPYSAKAKRILTDKYAIVPRPHIVELDKHPLGAALQNLLEKTTGRRTVPNILINGKSIGGGDDIEASEIAGTLVEKIQNMGGKRITSLTKVRYVLDPLRRNFEPLTSVDIGD